MRADKEQVYNELLVLRSRRRDPGALEELIRYWERRLFYYVRRLVNEEEDAWDILQETWLQVVRGLRRLRDPRRLRIWLYRVARNTAMSHLRRQYDERAVLENETEEVDVAATDEGIRLEDVERVHHGLGQISLPHREVLTLHFLEGMSVQEISEVLGIQSGTVKSRLHYAKRALRERLEKEGSA